MQEHWTKQLTGTIFFVVFVIVLNLIPLRLPAQSKERPAGNQKKERKVHISLPGTVKRVKVNDHHIGRLPLDVWLEPGDIIRIPSIGLIHEYKKLDRLRFQFKKHILYLNGEPYGARLGTWNNVPHKVDGKKLQWYSFSETPSKAQWKELTSGSSVTSLHLSGSGISDRDLKRLSNMSKLRCLVLQTNSFTDAGLKHLRSLENLVYLDVTGGDHLNTKITDTGLRYISSISTLRYLDISVTKISNAGLVFLQSLPNLTGLRLYHTEISSSGLKHLKKLTSLSSLDLSDTVVNGNELHHLKNLKKLEMLSLNNRQISSNNLQKLPSFPRLNYLNIYTPNLNSKTLKFLRSLSSLRYVSITVKKCEGKGLRHLKSLSDLNTLRLQGQNTVSTVNKSLNLKTISSLKNLRRLKIMRMSVDDFAPLENFENVVNLNLSLTNISNEDFGFLSSLSNLRSLSLANTRISEGAFQRFKKLTNLQYLDLLDVQLSDEGMKHLEALINLSFLRFDGIDITDQGMKSLGKLQNLLTLTVYRPIKVSGDGFRHLQNLKRLRQLHAEGARISIEDLKYLSSLEELNVLNLDHSNVTLNGCTNLISLRNLRRIELRKLDTKKVLPYLRHLRTKFGSKGKVPEHPEVRYLLGKKEQILEDSSWIYAIKRNFLSSEPALCYMITKQLLNQIESKKHKHHKLISDIKNEAKSKINWNDLFKSIRNRQTSNNGITEQQKNRAKKLITKLEAEDTRKRNRARKQLQSMGMKIYPVLYRKRNSSIPKKRKQIRKLLRTLSIRNLMSRYDQE